MLFILAACEPYHNQQCCVPLDLQSHGSQCERSSQIMSSSIIDHASTDARPAASIRNRLGVSSMSCVVSSIFTIVYSVLVFGHVSNNVKKSI
jgi:hypothetical protein